MSPDHGRRDRSKSQAATNGPGPFNQRSSNPIAPPKVEERTQNEGEREQSQGEQSAGDCTDLSHNFEVSSKAATDVLPSTKQDYEKTNPRSPTEIHNSSTKEQPALHEPPVTKKTLSELDVNKIVHNPKLRHDINFDPDLHFRPNLDGEKGRRKTEKTDGFYETFRIQLEKYFMNREQFEKELGEGDVDWCLPATLKAIKGILETLVPQRDRQSVEESFNVELLMQQFRKGVADLPKLALWLSQLLKCHCAPMRDKWVDDMVTAITNGDQTRDVALLVGGIRQLLGVLEAMKLDVANHQIRCLRPLLIEDTVHFEQKFFMKKIAAHRVDISGAHAWFKRASSLPEVGQLSQSRGNFWDFMKALVNLTLQSKSSETVPHTFLFDEERLLKLRTDIEDVINLEICMHMFRGLELNAKVQESRSPALDDTPIISAPSSRSSSPALGSVPSSPLIPPQDIIQKLKRAQERGHFRRELSGQQVWVPNLDNDSLTPSITSSPRSSTMSTPGSYSPTPSYLLASFPDSASRIRNSLLAILASSNTSDKWTTLAPALAIEVLRSTNTPLTHLPQFESHLDFHLSNPSSRLYQDAEKKILAQLFTILERLVEKYTPMTSLQIFEAATSSKSTANPSSHVNGSKEEIEEIATRIAHIGTLHWRVWAPLAYLVDSVEPEAEPEDETMQDAIQRRPSTTA